MMCASGVHGARGAWLACLAVVLGAAACDGGSGGDADGADTGDGDVPGRDMTRDEEPAGDRPADGSEEGGAPGDLASDLATDADVPGGTCDYLDLQMFLFVCVAEFVFVPEWSDAAGNDAACPRYWTWGGESFDSLAEAAAAAGCTTDCPYALSTAVMFLHCGHRDEYMVWKAPDEACPDRLQFQTGFYESVEAYAADNPC